MKNKLETYQKIAASTNKRLDSKDIATLEKQGFDVISLTDRHGNLTRAVLMYSHCFGGTEGMPAYGLAITEKGVIAVENHNDGIWKVT